MRKQGPNTTPAPSRRIHDETPARAPKLPELAGCPSCHASYRNGRWTWKKPPVDAYPHLCPACTRIESRYPAGSLDVRGSFATSHREELIHLLRNIEKREREEHPLKRIMEIDDAASGFVVTVTDAKLARSLGRGLAKAYSGHLEQPPTDEKENMVRVRWTRDQ